MKVVHEKYFNLQTDQKLEISRAVTIDHVNPILSMLVRLTEF